MSCDVNVPNNIVSAKYLHVCDHECLFCSPYVVLTFPPLCWFQWNLVSIVNLIAATLSNGLRLCRGFDMHERVNGFLWVCDVSCYCFGEDISVYVGNVILMERLLFICWALYFLFTLRWLIIFAFLRFTYHLSGYILSLCIRAQSLLLLIYLLAEHQFFTSRKLIPRLDT